MKHKKNVVDSAKKRPNLCKVSMYMILGNQKVSNKRVT
jgi:hypothetical protein